MYALAVQQAINEMDKSNKDHVSIDFDKLEDSLRGEFKTLYPFSKDRCIYRVPSKTRMLNQSFYTPKMVSIGPLHHGRKELKAMEEHKLRYLQQFLDRTRVGMQTFLKFIKYNEIKLRNCYAETIKFGSEAFVKMILLDAVFLIEILLRYSPGFDNIFTIVDPIFTGPGMIIEMMFDIMSLENQLPIFILEDLFKLANPTMPEEYEGYSLSQFTSFSFEHICEVLLIKKTLLEFHFSKSKHFVDLLTICLEPPKRFNTKKQADSQAAPNVTILHQSGVKFELASDKKLLDITFNKWTLEIPKLTISNMSVHLLRNLQIFEKLHYGTNYINDYDMLLHRLLSTPKDVEFLTHIGVIENRILDSEGVSTVFRQLSRDARVHNSNFYYSGVVKDLQDYCKSPYNEQITNLKQNYFNTPWSGIKVVVAGIILVLTFIQAICSILGL
ncbi:hypothetical protein EZV62_018840 [Acer yangbiense]|uniref:Uncharacterized protein n=1 Tax=Acer yangbiense TaxID=1000413 RepID=A0A5C7H9G2_9ROSI|nr:hypothetical protein EZV62_018840 [Acer yangbiense]